MKKKYLIGLDIGTSSIKGILIEADRLNDPSDEGIVSGRQPFKYRTAADGAADGTVEIDADAYLSACCALLRELSAKAAVADGEIVGVSAASASGNLLLLGEDGKPITPIYNWQDRRTKDEVDAVLGKDFDKKAYFASTGWAFDGHTFPLATLCRLKAKEPEKLAAAREICMSTEYLYRTLCGEWGISTSAGTPFYLIDQVTGTYRADILEKFGFAPSGLPPVVPEGTVIGRVTEAGAALCGLPVGTPLVAGTFDHPSAARGVGVLKEGQLLLSCGTSWVGFYPVNDRARLVDAGLLIDPFLSGQGGPWAGMVSLASVASRIDEYVSRWFGTGPDRYKKFEAASKESREGANGLKILLGEGDDFAVIDAHEKSDIARAIMEGVITMLKKDLDRLSGMGIRAASAVMVGGPTECPFWKEVIRYMTGLDVTISHGAFAGARGAAKMAARGAALGAALGAGLYE